MSIADLVNINIRVTGSGPSRTNFGTPLIACQHSVSGRPLVEAFASLREAETAGHTSGTPVHDMLTVAFAQRPRPKQIKVGKRTARAQVVRITPVDVAPANGVVFKGTIDEEAWTYTVSGSPTLATICTAIASAINALTVAVTASGASGTYVDVTSASGAWHDYVTTALAAVQTMTDATGDTNVDTDLSAFEAFDPDFYAVLIDTSSEQDIKDASAWCETRNLIFTARTFDGGVPDAAVTSDVASDLVVTGPTRTTVWAVRETLNFLDVGITCQRLTANPGSDSWAYKTLSNVRVATWTTSEENALRDKNANYYNSVKGLSLTFWGMSPAGEWIDIVRGIDWLVARMQERVLALFAANEKIDYDDGGIALVAAEVRAQLGEAASEQVRFITPDYTVIVPLSADISDAQKATRTLANLDFTAILRGAILIVDPINGTLTY